MPEQSRTQNGRTWKIGELARDAGLTIRTLHHYDRLGLLTPQARTEGGHRCYTAADVRRLHRIVALRSLGLSLAEIGSLLDEEHDPADLLCRQLDAVEERIRAAVGLRTRLADILSRNAEPTTTQLLQLIEETITMNEPLTPEKLAELKSRRQEQISALSETELAALKQRRDDAWQALGRQEQDRLTEQRRKLLPPEARS